MICERCKYCCYFEPEDRPFAERGICKVDGSTVSQNDLCCNFAEDEKDE